MNIKEAVNVLKAHNRWRRGYEDDMPHGPSTIGEAIDTVVTELEKPLPTDVQKEAWNDALKEVEALMRKPCWDLTLCEDIKKLKK